LKLFLNLSKPIQRVIGVVTALVGVLSLAAGAWILFGSQITMAAGLFLSLLGPIALVVAAVAGLYYAWDRNLFGIQDITRNAMDAVMGFLEPVTGFLGDLKDAWDGAAPSSDVMSKISAWGGLSNATTMSVMDQVNAWGGLSTEMSIAERAMNALDVASGGMITNMRQGFSALREMFSELGAMNAYELTGWVLNVGIPTITGWIVDAAGDVWGALKAAAGWSWDQVVDLGRITLSVAWKIVETAGGIWDAISDFVMGGGADAGLAGDGTGGASPRTAYPIGEVALEILDWTVTAAVMIGERVWSWITAAVSGISRVALGIGTFWLKILDWEVTTAKEIGPTVRDWITGTAIPAIGRAAIDIGTFWLKIIDWEITAAIDLATKVQQYIQGLIGGVGSGGSMEAAPGGMRAVGGGIPIPAIALSIADWVVDSAADLGVAILIWVSEKVGAIDFTGVGLTLKSKFFAAMGAAFSVGGDIGAALGGVLDLGASILDWATAQIEGVNWEAAGSTFATLLVAGIKAAVVGTVAIGGLAGSLLGGILNSLVEVNWSAVGTSFKDFFVAAIKAVGQFFVGFGMTLGEELIAAMGDIPWTAIGTKIKDGFIDAVTGIGTAIGEAIAGELPGWARDMFGLSGGSTDLSGTRGAAASSYSDAANPSRPKNTNYKNDGLITMLPDTGAGTTAGMSGVLIALQQITTDITAEVGKWPGIIDGAAALLGAAGLNAGAVAGYGVVNGIGLATTAIETAAAAWPTAINNAAALMGTAALNAGMVAGFGVVNGLAMAQPMIDGAFLLWASGINLAAAAMGAAALNAGMVAGFGVVNGITMAQGAVNSATAAWTTSVNGQAGPMGAAGLNAGMVAGFGVVNGLGMASGSISGAVGAWPGIINGIAGAMGAAGLNAGAAAGFGVANGLNSALGSVQTAASEIAAVVASTMALKLLISSPSKVTERIGAFAGEGLARGILGSESRVVAAATQVVKRAQAAARLQAEDGSWVPKSFYTGNSPLFNQWKKLFTAGQTAMSWTNYKNQGMAAGTAFGNGVAAGARSSLQIRSPSKVLSGMGVYAAQGFMQGFAGAYDSPVLDFTSRVPQLPSGVGSGSLAGAGASGNNAPTYNVYVTVEGNVTSERALTATITRDIANGIRSDLIRHRTASGVAQ
ncbi:MAG: hypothetical protein M3440_09260, partial [Chloroflexota bacterium]|nr:hypothetical protein [Chloroflexota bacterium]